VRAVAVGHEEIRNIQRSERLNGPGLRTAALQQSSRFTTGAFSLEPDGCSFLRANEVKLETEGFDKGMVLGSSHVSKFERSSDLEILRAIDLPHWNSGGRPVHGADEIPKSFLFVYRGWLFLKLSVEISEFSHLLTKKKNRKPRKV
jgi:hypothetical protein